MSEEAEFQNSLLWLTTLTPGGIICPLYNTFFNNSSLIYKNGVMPTGELLAGGGRPFVRLDAVGETQLRLDAHGPAVLEFTVGLLDVDLRGVEGHGGTELPDISRPVEMMMMVMVRMRLMMMMMMMVIL
jgi:hypothetical protein